jgi:2,3-diketo-5-methylthio-1-phosphopentane phosphatase
VTRVVVLDIEGTTSPTAYVTATLFPYARERYRGYLSAHAGEPQIDALLALMQREQMRLDALDVDAAVALLEQWTDQDLKRASLKSLQGWIWQEGFDRGELTAPFFPDVVPALRAWHESGITLAVFSSGSVDAQHAWFGHSPDGDLQPLIRAWFDLDTAGPKREQASYDAITDELGVAPGDIVFLSDVRAELDAARAAGWQTVGVRRTGEPQYDAGVGDHRETASFADLVITAG